MSPKASVAREMPTTAPVATPVQDRGSRRPYAALAAEYDDPEHRTTRVLEALSASSLRRAACGPLRDHDVELIVEVGAGTGALTSVLLKLWPRAALVASDASREMLEVLASKLTPSDASRSTLAVADVQAFGRTCRATPSLIVAGLADPYLDAAALTALRAASGDGTRLFVSVPSRHWARREREERLGISIATTRFRTRGGGIVFAPSSTYDENGLRQLLNSSGFDTTECGTERSDALWSRPSVCWGVAVPDHAAAT
jgi:SAM-dependent methyltransferase